MNSKIESIKVAQAIATIWNIYKSGGFLNYLESTFKVIESSLPDFRCMFIAESDDGDMQTGPFGALVKHWWQVDDNGVQEITVPKMDWNGNIFYATPKILFYTNTDSVVIFERYGPKKLFCKKGKLINDGDSLQINSIEVIK